MRTQRFNIATGDRHGAMESAAGLLRAGELVAFPTETVYGLGANAWDADAVAKIFVAKQRPAWDPVIVHIAAMEMLHQVIAALPAQVSERATALTREFWPGPLTLLLPKSPRIPGIVTAGRELVGVRMPAHPVATELIAAAGVPIAAPSANLFGHVSPTTADHVLADLDGRIAAIMDAGPCRVGVESTVLDITAPQPVLYRPGGVTREQIAHALGEPVLLYRDTETQQPPESLPSPGVGMRHYAPRTRLILVDAQAQLLEAAQHHSLAGVLLPTGWHYVPGTVTYPWGDWNNPQQLASRLYDGLRWLDEQNVDCILCPLPPESDEAAAIRDRLRKGARPR